MHVDFLQVILALSFFLFDAGCYFRHENTSVAEAKIIKRAQSPKMGGRRGDSRKKALGKTDTGAAEHEDSDEAEENLLTQLIVNIFGDYHKELVPKRPTTVKLDLLMMKVKSTNEREGIFESVVSLFMEWQDRRLVWDAYKYENVTVLAIDSDKVWLPDIAMINSADHVYSISKDTRFVVRVTSNGKMNFVPTGTARTWCDLKLLTFPFDMQTCSYEFESWSLDSSTMTINETSSAMVDEAFSSPQWALCGHKTFIYDHFYTITGENFTRLRFDFSVRRKTTFYIINLIFPCGTLSMIQLMVFLIPSTDATSDRVAFGTTSLLTLVVFQTIVTEEMPKSSDSVTALSKYIIALIVISAVGIIESITAERLLRPTMTPPPTWLSNLTLPLLWESQLPGGISGMMLQRWNLSTQRKQKKKTSVKKKQLVKSGSGNKRKSPPPSSNKISQRLQSASTIAADELEAESDCLCKKNKFKKLQSKKKPKDQDILRQAVNRSVSEYTQAFCYETSTIRQTPSPVFEPTSGFLRYEDPVSQPNGRLRRGSYGESLAGMSETTTTDGNNEVDLIEIGKQWGAIVTRLDGLSFALCGLCVFFLPLFLFLPVVLTYEQC